MTELVHPAGDAAPGGVRRGRASAADRLKQLARRAIGPDAYVGARSVLRFARGSELRAPFSMTHKLDAWRRGFRAESAAIYDLGRNDARDYVSDDARRRCNPINPAPEFFRHKLMLRAVLLTRGFAQPETVALFSEGNFLINPLAQANGWPTRYVGGEELERLLIADGGRYIVKPQNGMQGQGVFLAEVQNGALVRRRGTEARPFRLADVRGVTIVERVVPQSAFWRGLFPHSANTVRAMTMWAPGDPAPFIGAAVQRIGTADTAPTDNWSGGGICAPINLETGRMGVGRAHPLKGPKGERWRDRYTHHPDTGAQIEGAVLPGWAEITDTVLRAAASLPTNRYVGWDVLVDEAGTPLILEGNGNSAVNLMQVHGGLLADPKVRRFYERCGIV